MVTVCVVLYNSEPFLKTFFESLIAASENISEIFFFDNNSTDKTIPVLTDCIEKTKPHKNLPNIEVIRSAQNVGFAKAVNICVSKSNGDDIFLINPNSIIKKNAVRSLLSFYQKHPRSVCAGRYVEYRKGGGTQPSAVASSSFKDCLLQLTNVGKLLPFSFISNNFWEREMEKVTKVVGVTAGFTLFSKKLFRKLNGFDEGYFMYLEDLDFCVRAKKAGFSVYFYPEATLRHFGGGSSLDKKNHYSRDHWVVSRSLFFRKHFSNTQYFLYAIVDHIERQFGLV